MKKLLALLLALLLPGCAAGETMGLSVSVELDESSFAAYAKQILQIQPQLASLDLDSLSAAAAKSLNGLGANVAVQKDAAALQISLGNGELLNLAVHTAEDAVYVTSPMLSGYALCDSLPVDGDTEVQLAETDWESVGKSVTNALSVWLENVEPTVIQGAFEGDAYTGGTQCVMWILSDMDVAALLSSLATEEVRQVVLNLAKTIAGVDGTALLSRFDELNDQVADADTYMYILRIVTNEADEFVGASLTIIEENAQVATCSLGVTENTVNLVVGLGLNENNYWWEFSGKYNRQENIAYMSGSSREWIADKSESFSYVSTTNAPLATYLLRCSLTQSAERILWDGSVSEGQDADSDCLCSFKGSFSQEKNAFECSIGIGGGSSTLFRLNFKIGPAEAIAPMDKALKLCSVSSEADAALYDELMQKFTASLMARLIKLLPMDLIMTINQVTVPQ